MTDETTDLIDLDPSTPPVVISDDMVDLGYRALKQSQRGMRVSMIEYAERGDVRFILESVLPHLTPAVTPGPMPVVTEADIEWCAKKLWLFDVTDADDDEQDVDNSAWESDQSPDSWGETRDRYRRTARTVLEANAGWSIRRMQSVAHLPHPPGCPVPPPPAAAIIPEAMVEAAARVAFQRSSRGNNDLMNHQSWIIESWFTQARAILRAALPYLTPAPTPGTPEDFAAYIDDRLDAIISRPSVTGEGQYWTGAEALASFRASRSEGVTDGDDHA